MGYEANSPSLFPLRRERAAGPICLKIAASNAKVAVGVGNVGYEYVSDPQSDRLAYWAVTTVRRKSKKIPIYGKQTATAVLA